MNHIPNAERGGEVRTTITNLGVIYIFLTGSVLGWLIVGNFFECFNMVHVFNTSQFGTIHDCLRYHPWYWKLSI